MNTEMKNNQSAARRGKPRPGVSSTQEGFTLIELLVVIAIIGLLASLLLPTLVRAKESSRATVCRNDLRQIGLAAHMYADDYNDTFFCLQGGVVPYGIGRWDITNTSAAIRECSVARMGSWWINSRTWGAIILTLFGATRLTGCASTC
jgi:prepilin-type N-terminal cleavage/methylation domain-containing protein